MADMLAMEVSMRESEFRPNWVSADEAVAEALRFRRARPSARPVVLADAQDNPGAGANADTLGLLRALLAADIGNVAFGLLCDPEAAAKAHAAGKGAVIAMELGAKSGGAPGELPLHRLYEVEALSDGEVDATGPFMGGSQISLGSTALLRADHVRIVVCSRKDQCADRTLFTHLGVDLSSQDIVAVKSAVHFRADFDPIAAETIVVECPGPGLLDHRSYRYRNLRPGVRVMPQG
jgi:microcystin degradation protein MlrC